LELRELDARISPGSKLVVRDVAVRHGLLLLTPTVTAFLGGSAPAPAASIAAAAPLVAAPQPASAASAAIELHPDDGDDDDEVLHAEMMAAAVAVEAATTATAAVGATTAPQTAAVAAPAPAAAPPLLQLSSFLHSPRERLVTMRRQRVMVSGGGGRTRLRTCARSTPHTQANPSHPIPRPRAQCSFAALGQFPGPAVGTLDMRVVLGDAADPPPPRPLQSATVESAYFERALATSPAAFYAAGAPRGQAGAQGRRALLLPVRVRVAVVRRPHGAVRYTPRPRNMRRRR